MLNILHICPMHQPPPTRVPIHLPTKHPVYIPYTHFPGTGDHKQLHSLTHLLPCLLSLRQHSILQGRNERDKINKSCRQQLKINKTTFFAFLLPYEYVTLHPPPLHLLTLPRVKLAMCEYRRRRSRTKSLRKCVPYCGAYAVSWPTPVTRTAILLKALHSSASTRVTLRTFE